MFVEVYYIINCHLSMSQSVFCGVENAFCVAKNHIISLAIRFSVHVHTQTLVCTYVHRI